VPIPVLSRPSAVAATTPGIGEAFVFDREELDFFTAGVTASCRRDPRLADEEEESALARGREDDFVVPDFRDVEPDPVAVFFETRFFPALFDFLVSLRLPTFAPHELPNISP
jgi:hypothetical protein